MNDSDAEPLADDESNAEASRKPNAFYRLAVIASGAFIVTILAVMASAISDQRAPVVKLIDQFGTSTLAVEVLVIMIATLFGMASDRGPGRRNQRPPN
ncbi:MAG: hypothetical protein CMJ78_03165 [Planctomycetaceae bacterium]|nr:hypothetical protein [Planctomycetaceae bacterium]